MRLSTTLHEKIKNLTSQQRHTLRIKVNELKLSQQCGGIAIVGVSFQFPQEINQVDELWDVLCTKKNQIDVLPNNRKQDTPLQWSAGYLKEVDKFDAGFFNLSVSEAKLMDPQQRLLMEVIWKSIEDAGYNPKKYGQNKTGLFVGLCSQDYYQLLNQADMQGSTYAITGNSPAMLSNRISYWFDFNGPSVTVDTACSSSLVALDNAINAIKIGQCEQAIVGGVNLILAPSFFQAFEDAGMLSPTNSCKSFDDQADGYVRGEGVVAICLKPLRKAQMDGDDIYAVILGSAINHGGKANSLTAPNPIAQKDLILSACDNAKISLETISYIEAHGTGTSLGDPIEIEALQLAFLETSKLDINKEEITPHCGVGTIKTNIGHLEAVAGLAGVVKVLLALKHKKIPGNPHLKSLSSKIKLDNSPLYIAKDTVEWKQLVKSNGEILARRAGVSSFGFGGANAHVILEECNNVSSPTKTLPAYYIVTVSAKDEKSLEQQLKLLSKWLQGNTESSLADVSYTLAAGRYHFKHRCAFVVDSIKILENKLNIAKDNFRNSFDGYIYDQSEKEDSELLTDYNQLLIILFDKVNQTQDFHSDEYYENLTVMAELYTRGCKINWSNLAIYKACKRIHLPTYIFSKKRYWFSD